MAKRKDTEQQYYYFKCRLNGTPYEIKVTTYEINTILNRIYVEMTQEQQEFYLANPTATVQEVWICELTPPYVPPTPDVSEYAAQKVKELQDACLAVVTVTTLEYAMAMDKTQNITADSYYTLVEAQRVVSNFRNQSKHAMQVRDTYTPQIEAAATIEAIDTIYQQAMEAL